MINEPLFTAVGALEQSSLKNLNIGIDDCNNLIDGLDKCLGTIEELLKDESEDNKKDIVYDIKDYTRGFDLSLWDLMDQAKELYDTNVTLDKDSKNLIAELNNVLVLKKQVIDKKESFIARIKAKKEFKDKHKSFSGIIHCYDKN